MASHLVLQDHTLFIGLRICFGASCNVMGILLVMKDPMVLSEPTNTLGLTS